MLEEYIAYFENGVYAVWPILYVPCLLNRLSLTEEGDLGAYVLACALSAATASQLQLPVLGSDPKINAAYLAAQALKCRTRYQYREQPSLDAIQTSFFLHIYYATLLKFRSSMMFLQEAIAFAKLLEVTPSLQQNCRPEELGDIRTLLVSILPNSLVLSSSTVVQILQVASPCSTSTHEKY